MIWEVMLDAEGDYFLLGVISGELLPSDATPLPDGDAERVEDWVYVLGLAVAIVVFLLIVLFVFLRKRKEGENG